MHPALRTSVVFLAALVPVGAHAQQDKDKAAIQSIIQDLNAAWNRGDADAFSTHFAPDGSFTNIVGMQTYGRAPFQKQHAYIFSTIYKGSHLESTLGTLRFIRPDVAIADIDGVLSNMVRTPPGTPLFPDGSMHVKLQLVLAKESSAWQIDAFHNVVVNPALSNPGPPK